MVLRKSPKSSRCSAVPGAMLPRLDGAFRREGSSAGVCHGSTEFYIFSNPANIGQVVAGPMPDCFVITKLIRSGVMVNMERYIITKVRADHCYNHVPAPRDGCNASFILPMSARAAAAAGWIGKIFSDDDPDDQVEQGEDVCHRQAVEHVK